MAQQESLRFTQKYHFLIRRLHSLSGIVPVGVFLFFHLVTNASILAPNGGQVYQDRVDQIHALGPLLVPLEIVGIFIPILFHAILGFVIWLGEAEPNAQYYRYGPNVRYTLQRITGGIAFIFIAYHVWHLHWVGAPFGGGFFQAHVNGEPAAADTTARALQSASWIAALYAVGIIASVYHFANGIWTSLITWGITIHPKSQRVAGYVCATFGVILTAIGLGALFGFRTFKPDEPQARISIEGEAPAAALSDVTHLPGSVTHSQD